MRVPERCDVCVVGGGASGLAAAIAAAEAGASVVVLERAAECGRTILATGNGRCNLSNARLERGRYNDPAFVEAVCGAAFGSDVLGFLEGCGLAVVEEGGGRLYPLSRQAASVRTTEGAPHVRVDLADREPRELTRLREVLDAELAPRGQRVRDITD